MLGLQNPNAISNSSFCQRNFFSDQGDSQKSLSPKKRETKPTRSVENIGSIKKIKKFGVKKREASVDIKNIKNPYYSFYKSDSTQKLTYLDKIRMHKRHKVDKVSNDANMV